MTAFANDAGGLSQGLNETNTAVIVVIVLIAAFKAWWALGFIYKPTAMMATI
jgi:hypothetical protein